MPPFFAGKKRQPKWVWKSGFLVLVRQSLAYFTSSFRQGSPSVTSSIGAGLRPRGTRPRHAGGGAPGKSRHFCALCTVDATGSVPYSLAGCCDPHSRAQGRGQQARKYHVPISGSL